MRGEVMTFKAQWYRDKLPKKRAKGFCGYSVATVAFYGPDESSATKVSVGIVMHEGADADPLERWFCKTTDARTDPEITEAIVRFIDQHGANLPSQGRSLHQALSYSMTTVTKQSSTRPLDSSREKA